MCPRPRALAAAAAGHRIIPCEIYSDLDTPPLVAPHAANPPAQPRTRGAGGGGEREVRDATLPDSVTSAVASDASLRASGARSLPLVVVVVRSSPRFLPDVNAHKSGAVRRCPPVHKGQVWRKTSSPPNSFSRSRRSVPRRNRCRTPQRFVREVNQAKRALPD